MISGVSAWRTGAARWHEGVPAYRRALGAADAALRPLLGWSVRDVLLSGAEPPAAEPVAFAVAYAAGRTLADVGVKPAWTVGEGVGEYAAAVLACVFGLEDACRLVAAYGASERRPPRTSPAGRPRSRSTRPAAAGGSTTRRWTPRSGRNVPATARGSTRRCGRPWSRNRSG
ncbi:acyltransferase domain-containing protein [Actinomadura luteofluorescens]|uniref:acyltransferase domain-containing protein n=1 Tax=Actinomadura luteofluorescens TaxID=46163 RepID=UPI0036303333